MQRLTLWAGVAAIAVLAIGGAPQPAQAQPAWEQISKTGKMRFGIMPARPPYMWQDAGQTEWKGFTITMAKQIVEALENENAIGRKIEIEYVPTTWATFVLDIQANKIDAFLGASITEERKKAVDMYGPLYGLAHVFLNRDGFNPGPNWADYDKPSVKIASVTGTTDEAAARKFAPKATINSLRQDSEAILAVQSGHADALVSSVLPALNALKQNPNFKAITVPRPVASLPSGGAARKDGDGRLTAFLQGWAYMSRASGNTKKVILDSVALSGLDASALPPEMEF